MSSPQPQPLLYAAQTAIARKDFVQAAKLFTDLLALFPPDANPAICLLSRCSCYMQLKDYQKVVADAEKILKLEAIHTPEELVPGCYNTRTAAAVRLAKAHEYLGNKSKSEVYKKLASELLRASAVATERAIQLKESGNELFRSGDLAGSLEKYNEALALNGSDETVLSNASLVLMKLNRLKEAATMADRCVQAKPEWSKGWFRKGMVAMKRKQYTKAASAFQSGIGHNPDDAELKKMYSEATRLAEKTSSKDGGFDKFMMGMMMDLGHNSWDVNKWYNDNRQKVQYWSPDDWPTIVPHLSSPSACKTMETCLRIVDPSLSSGLLPKTTSSSTESPALPLKSYILPSTPLITLQTLHSLFQAAHPTHRYSMVWTFSAPPAAFVRTPLYADISQHQIYCALVSRTANIVVDFLSIWAGEDEGGRWFKEMVAGDKKDAIRWYCCEDERKFVEFLEGMYGGQRELQEEERVGGKGRAVRMGSVPGAKIQELNSDDEEEDEEELQEDGEEEDGAIEEVAKPAAGTVREFLMRELELGAILVVVVGILLVVSGAVDVRFWSTE